MDAETPISASSFPGSSQLDSDGQVWVGGSPNLPWGLPREYYDGFQGCLDSVIINGQPLSLLDHRNSHRSSVAFCDS